MRCCDQGAHIRERLTANRSDLTLQGGPNQHGTYLPRRTIHAKQYSAYRFRLPPTPGMRLVQFKHDQQGQQRLGP